MKNIILVFALLSTFAVSPVFAEDSIWIDTGDISYNLDTGDFRVYTGDDTSMNMETGEVRIENNGIVYDINTDEIFIDVEDGTLMGFDSGDIEFHIEE